MSKTENKNANCKIAGDIGIDTEMLSSLLELGTEEMERNGLNHVRKRKIARLRNVYNTYHVEL